MLVPVQSLINSSDGKSLLFKDITGTTSATAYSKSGNIGYADVEAVRIKIASYTATAGAEQISYGSDFTQYREYVKTSGATSTINGKDFSVGAYFTPQSAAISVPSGDTWQWTGYYTYPYLANWLPTAAQVELTITMSDLGVSSTTLPDDIYTCVYEVYYDIATTTQVAVSGQQYMVVSGTCTYSAQTFYAGEIFTATDTSNITTTGSYAKLNATSLQYFVLAYTLISSILVFIEQTSGTPGYDPDMPVEIYMIRVQLEALSYSCQTSNVSYSYAMNLINNLTAKVTYLLNNN